MQWVYKKEIIPAIFVAIAFTIFALIFNKNEKDAYKEDGIITNALVTGYKYDYKGRLEVQFEFFVKSKIVKGNTSFPELKGGAEQYLKGKYFPVIFLNSKTEKNELLASFTKFKKFSLSIPDSLLWLNKIERSW